MISRSTADNRATRRRYIDRKRPLFRTDRSDRTRFGLSGIGHERGLERSTPETGTLLMEACDFH